MLRDFINRFIKRRHYWRDIGFDELSELYTSMMFRSLAINLVGIFIPIYLFQLGYAIWQILFFFGIVYFVWTIFHLPAAYLIAKFGPKHTMLTSYVFHVMAMLLLLTQGEQQWPLAAIATILGVSNALFYLSFHVDFSKVKHRDHGGKELGWMLVMEKAGGVLGPLIGGLVGYFIGAEYIFLVAVALLFIGILPLFLTTEPIKTNHKLNLYAFSPSTRKRDMAAMSFFGIEGITSLVFWPLFIGAFVLQDNPYIQLGSIVTFSVLLSLIIARIIGKTVDNHKGRILLRVGASLNGLLHLFRPFTSGYPFALGINLANEAIVPAYRMPLVKGLYDAADEIPDGRIIYLTVMESVASFVKALLLTVMGLLAFWFEEPKTVFTIMFIVAAITSPAIMVEKFKALDPKR